MPEPIDHVIVAAANLQRLEDAFARLGFAVVGGGEHPHLGTRNRIILLDTGYIELLAIANAQAVSAGLRQRIDSAPGWIGFAVQSGDIGVEVAAMRARGADVRGPNPGRLVAPDGRARSWRVATVGGDDLFQVAEPIPFLIQHDTSGLEHQQELVGADAIVPHPNGAQRLENVIIAVDDLATAQTTFARVYGLAAVDVPGSDTDLNAETVALPLGASQERIILAQPRGSGIVAQRLESAGAGLCCVTVAVSNVDTTGDFFTQSGVPFKRWNDGVLIPASVTGGAPLAFVAGA